MLWWDDNVGKNKKQETPLANSIVLESGDEISKCFRNTGAVPIPRKVSKSYNVPIRRKISAPENVKTEPQPPLAKRKISCPPPRTAPPPPRAPTPPPPPPQLKLLSAMQDTLEELPSDEVSDLKVVKDKVVIPRISSQPASPASLFIKSVPKPKVIQATEKAQVTEAEVKKELKRGSMKEKWGLSLVYRMENSRIELAVNKVSMFSPAAKAGMQSGDTILLINDWKVEAMDQIQAALGVFLAAGFSVNLGWTKSALCLEGWGVLDNI